jgi:hypothetical protein
MNRRGVIGLAARALSAIVFTSSGWLMGRGVLSMGPCPGGTPCDVFCAQYSYPACGTPPVPCNFTYPGRRMNCYALCCSDGTQCYPNQCYDAGPTSCPCP